MKRFLKTFAMLVFLSLYGGYAWLCFFSPVNPDIALEYKTLLIYDVLDMLSGEEAEASMGTPDVKTTTWLNVPFEAMDTTTGVGRTPDSVSIMVWFGNCANNAIFKVSTASLDSNWYDTTQVGAGNGSEKYYFREVVADIDADSGAGLYSGVILGWFQGYSTPNYFSFNLVDTTAQEYGSLNYLNTENIHETIEPYRNRKNLYCLPDSSAVVGGNATTWATACSLKSVMDKLTGDYQYYVYIAPGNHTGVNLSFSGEKMVTFVGAGIHRTVLTGVDQSGLEYPVFCCDNSNTGDVIIQDMTIQAYNMQHDGVGIKDGSLSGFEIRRCRIEGFDKGIDVRSDSKKTIVEHCFISRCAGSAVYVNNEDATIRYNVIDSLTSSASYGISLNATGIGSHIYGNIIYSAVGKGISATNDATAKNIIANNYVYAADGSYPEAYSNDNVYVGNHSRSERFAVDTTSTIQEDIYNAPRSANSDSNWTATRAGYLDEAISTRSAIGDTNSDPLTANDLWDLDLSGEAYDGDSTKAGDYVRFPKDSTATLGEAADALWGENDTTVVDTSKIGAWLIANISGGGSSNWSDAQRDSVLDYIDTSYAHIDTFFATTFGGGSDTTAIKGMMDGNYKDWWATMEPQINRKNIFVSTSGDKDSSGLTWNGAVDSLEIAERKCSGADEYYIYVAPGTYDSTCCTTNVANVHWIGSGQGFTFLTGNYGNPVMRIEANGIEITGFELAGGNDAIWINNSSHFNIHDNRMKNNTSHMGDGVLVFGSSHYGRIHDNYFHTQWGFCISLQGDYNLIYNNIMDSLRTEAGTRAIILSATAKWNTIHNNKIHVEGSSHGIEVADGSGDNFIVDNYVYSGTVGQEYKELYSNATAYVANHGRSGRWEQDTTSTIEEDIHFSTDSVNNAITTTNKANFKADVSGLSTFDPASDSVMTANPPAYQSSGDTNTFDIVNQLANRPTIGDTNTNPFQAGTDDVILASNLEDIAHRNYDTMYVHRDNFKGGTADSVYLYDSEFPVIANENYDTMYAHRDDFKGGTADSVYLYDAERAEISHDVYDTILQHASDFHSSGDTNQFDITNQLANRPTIGDTNSDPFDPSSDSVIAKYCDTTRIVGDAGAAQKNTEEEIKNWVKVTLEDTSNVARDATKDNYKDGTGGTGADTFDVYVFDGDTTAIEGIDITIYNNAKTAVPVPSILTNVNGKAQVFLDADIYQVYLQRLGVIHNKWDTITVTNNGIDTIWVIAQDAGSPPSGNVTRIKGYLRNLSYGQYNRGKISFTLHDGNVQDTSQTPAVFIDATPVEVTADTGYFEVDLISSLKLLSKRAGVTKDSVGYDVKIMSPGRAIFEWFDVLVPDSTGAVWLEDLLD